MIKEDIQPGYAPKEISFRGYTTKNLHHSADAAKAFQDTIARLGNRHPVEVLAALKHTDDYMKLNDLHLEQGKAPDESELKAWRHAHLEARNMLNNIGEFMHHEDYWHMHEHELQDMETNYTPSTAGAEMSDSYEPTGTLIPEQKRKTLKTYIANTMEDKPAPDEDAEDTADNIPTQIGSTMTHPADDQLRRRKVLYKLGEWIEMSEGVFGDPVIPNKKGEIAATEDIHTADYKVNPQTGHKYRARHITFAASKMGGDPEEGDDTEGKVDATKRKSAGPLLKPVKEEAENEHDDVSTESDLEDMACEIETEDDILDAYDDDELVIVDDETGESVEVKESVEQIDEVLSRSERMRAKMRFARTSSKRERRLKVVLKTRSSAATINKRARHLAINLLKQRIMKKPASQLSVGEKERVERMLSKRKNLINRLAMKLAPRVRKIENERLTHSKVTK